MRVRPSRLQHIAGIGVDRMGSIADASGTDFLRLENLDTDIPPDPAAVLRTRHAAAIDADNSYLPFVGQRGLRDIAAAHVSRVSGIAYSGERNCVISAGGLVGDSQRASRDDRGRRRGDRHGPDLCRASSTASGWRAEFRGSCRFALPPAGAGRSIGSDRARAVGKRTRAMLLMSPSMPSGACLDAGDWSLIADVCVAHDLLLILDTAMERLLFDGRQPIHPAGLPGMASRTISVGSSAKELRMIGWRVGWIVGPEELHPGHCLGFARQCGRAGRNRPGRGRGRSGKFLWPRSGICRRAAGAARHRHEAARGPAIRSAGWRLVAIAAGLGFRHSTARRCPDACSIMGSARPPRRDGARRTAPQYIRFVFANEPAERLELLGPRVRKRARPLENCRSQARASMKRIILYL